MELKWLEDFLAVARTGSFSRAATLRNVTQPALSRRIRSLEDWVGVPLIDRSSYPVGLTTLGEQFLPNAEEMVRQALGVRDDFRLLHRPPGTSLRLLSLHTLSTTLVPEAVSAFLALEPKARVAMSANVQGVEDHFDALASGTADILFTYGHTGIVEKTVKEANLAFMTLARDAFVPAATPERLKEWGPRPLERERGTIPYLALASPSFSERLLMPVVRRYARQLRVVYEDTLSESLRAMALRGAGLAWLPLHVVSGDVAAGRLALLPDAGLQVPYEIRAYRSRDNRSALTARMWSVLEGMSADRLGPAREPKAAAAGTDGTDLPADRIEEDGPAERLQPTAL